jgi:hypothetical protein
VRREHYPRLSARPGRAADDFLRHNRLEFTYPTTGWRILPNPYEGGYAAVRPCHGKELGAQAAVYSRRGSGPREAVGTMVLGARL